jgi:predicted enzyme related to lactoylglutathione lyase
MPNTRHGAIVWREILTNDLPGTLRFYTELFGWKVEEVPMGPGLTYNLLKAGDVQVGGAMPIAGNMGPMPPRPRRHPGDRPLRGGDRPSGRDDQPVQGRLR